MSSERQAVEKLQPEEVMRAAREFIKTGQPKQAIELVDQFHAAGNGQHYWVYHARLSATIKINDASLVDDFLDLLVRFPNQFENSVRLVLDTFHSQQPVSLVRPLSALDAIKPNLLPHYLGSFYRLRCVWGFAQKNHRLALADGLRSLRLLKGQSYAQAEAYYYVGECAFAMGLRVMALKALSSAILTDINFPVLTLKCSSLVNKIINASADREREISVFRTVNAYASARLTRKTDAVMSLEPRMHRVQMGIAKKTPPALVWGDNSFPSGKFATGAELPKLRDDVWVGEIQAAMFILSVSGVSVFQGAQPVPALSFPQVDPVGLVAERIKPVFQLQGTSLALFGYWGRQNYCHFLLEQLPRLFLANACGAPFDRILIDEDAPPVAESILAAVAPGKEVSRIPTPSLVHCSTAVVCSPLKHPAHHASPTFIQGFRTLAAQLAMPGAGEKIYVKRRRGRRGFVNEEVVEAILKNHGYQTVFLEELGFAQQVSVFAGARSVFSIHGAGLSNMVFCAKGAVIFEVIPRRYFTPAFNVLASGCGHFYIPMLDSRYTPCESDARYKFEDVLLDEHILDGYLKRAEKR